MSQLLSVILGVPAAVYLVGWIFLHADAATGGQLEARATAMAIGTPTPSSPTPLPVADEDLNDLREARQGLEAMLEELQRNTEELERLELRMEARKYRRLMPFSVNRD